MKYEFVVRYYLCFAVNVVFRGLINTCSVVILAQGTCLQPLIYSSIPSAKANWTGSGTFLKFSSSLLATTVYEDESSGSDKKSAEDDEKPFQDLGAALLRP